MCGCLLNVVPGILPPPRKTRQVDSSKKARTRLVIQTMRFHLTKEVLVVSIPKVVGVLSCGFLLCLGLSLAALTDHAALAADDMNAGQSSDRKGGQAGIKGDEISAGQAADRKGGQAGVKANPDKLKKSID